MKVLIKPLAYLALPLLLSLMLTSCWKRRCSCECKACLGSITVTATSGNTVITKTFSTGGDRSLYKSIQDSAYQFRKQYSQTHMVQIEKDSTSNCDVKADVKCKKTPDHYYCVCSN